MKTFREYLAESKKQYKLTIKLSFKPDSAWEDRIESALGRFELVSASKARSLPIKKADRDFPTLSAPETYAIDVVLDYPASVEMVRNCLSQLGLAIEQVAVISTDWDESMTTEEDNIQKNMADERPLMMKDLEGNDVKTDSMYGTEYNKKLVKNSLTGKVSVKGAPKDPETTNDFPQGTKSPVGSTKNKLPEIKSFFK